MTAAFLLLLLLLLPRQRLTGPSSLISFSFLLSRLPWKEGGEEEKIADFQTVTNIDKEDILDPLCQILAV